MRNILDYFEQLTQIPHCSSDADALRDFLIDFASRYGYSVQHDSAGNILASKNSPKLAFQAHYDMVCVGRAPQIATYEKEGWLYARESTLGADNGIAVAMMMALMEEGRACEFLFTADEEVGLVGANALSFDLKSDYMLNLDSEDEAEVYIGCAGGVDVFAGKRYEMEKSEAPFYEVTVSGLPGGHSGVEIHKNIPNAIKLFGHYAQTHNLKIASIDAGERINSIPTHVRAVVSGNGSLPQAEHISVREMAKSEVPGQVIDGSSEVIEMIEKCPHGVLAMHETLGIPDRSVNLALLSLKDGLCSFATSARAMDAAGLDAVEHTMRDFFTRYGYSVRSEGKYPAWKPEINDFSRLVCEKVASVFGACDYKAIHAGLECAVLSDKYPKMQIASIGPNIRSPHSTHEHVEIASVEKTYRVVRKIVESLCA